MSVSPRARADLATPNSQLAGVAPMKNGARFGATSHPDPTDVTHGRLKDSDLARCLNRREMALWALEKKRQFSPFFRDGTSHHFSPFEGLPASLGPGLRTVSGADRRRGGFLEERIARLEEQDLVRDEESAADED